MKPQKHHPRHKSTAQPQEPMQESMPRGAVKGRAEFGRPPQHGGQLPQNQQRLGQHQNSRKQPGSR